MHVLAFAPEPVIRKVEVLAVGTELAWFLRMVCQLILSMVRQLISL